LEIVLDKNFQQYVLNNTLFNILELEKEFNGFTDTRQVIIWKKDGEEVCRSENGKHTVSPEFKQIIIAKINELY
jgi:hypothetical protein